MFDRNALPSDITVETVDTTNTLLAALRARKVPRIKLDGATRIEMLTNWVDAYPQAHIRRSLSFVGGGLAEYHAGRTIITALCARAILEDAAVMWIFIERFSALLDSGDEDKIDTFVFGRVLATKLPDQIKQFGDEIKATNILTHIDHMVRLNDKYRAVYDDLSEVVHPNSNGVFFHFASFGQESVASFDDGAGMADNALGSLITAAYMLACVEPAIHKLEQRLAAQEMDS
jgi:hypothetical protein